MQRAQQEPQDLRVLKVTLVKLDQQVQMVKTEIQVYRDRKVKLDHQVLKAILVKLDRKAKLD